MLNISNTTTHLREMILMYLIFKQIDDINNNLSLIICYNGSGFLKEGDLIIAEWNDAKEGLEQIETVLFGQQLKKILENE